ncbi:Glycosyltransferase 64 protein C4 [Dermatophagoides farinae]|uniref:Enhancer of polycomb-like protein n=1 Tax=Dermatophagoides farinae TaxID=6954 RepID=A0A922ID16_DERFA|nr:Glycosyltransferase 64 protein C4 [Dermatophagoides farinae]
MSQNLNKQLSFRPRNIDHFKPMQVLKTEDVPDLNNFATTINRTVPQMPTGMEKEEECEHHLQRAISAQQAYGRAVDHVIPTPEVFPVNEKAYDDLYPPTYKIPRQLIHVQLPSFEQDYPDYDLDSEDETWLSTTNLCGLPHTKFEEMIDCLERNSGVQKVIELNEAKSLLRDVDESLQIAVYDYWLAKKLKFGKSLIPTVKTEKRDGTSGNNPYIAFRRRTEKMQTRKNRKNDEYSYEKMLKLKKDIFSVCNIMSMIKEREKRKYELVKNDFLIFETRYQHKDFNSQIYNELMASRLTKDALNRTSKSKGDEPVARKKRTKRSKNDVLSTRNINEMIPSAAGGEYYTSEDENSSDLMYQSSQVNNEPDEADNPDGMFSFKRKKGCYYHAPLDHYSGWPWESLEEGGTADKRFRFSYTSLSCPAYSVGLTRRRIGRGGRIQFDRIKTHIDFSDDEEERIHYKPFSGESDVEQDATIEFNTRHFDEDCSMFINNQLKHYIDDSSLERQLYQYNERDLSNFIKENHHHYNNDRSTQAQSFMTNRRIINNRPCSKSSNGKIKPIEHQQNQCSSSPSFVKPLNVDLTNLLLNNTDNNNKDDSTITTILSSSMDKRPLDMNELKDSSGRTSNSVMMSSLLDDNNDDVDLDGLECSNEIMMNTDQFKQNSNSSSSLLVTVNVNNGPNHSMNDTNNKSDRNIHSSKQFSNEPSRTATVMTTVTATTTNNKKFECQSSPEYQNVSSSSSSSLPLPSCKLKLATTTTNTTTTTATSNQSSSATNNLHHSTDVT